MFVETMVEFYTKKESPTPRKPWNSPKTKCFIKLGSTNLWKKSETALGHAIG